MKKLTLFLLLLITILLSCSKNKTCYECEHGSGGQVFKEKVCTNDGHPENKLPDHDANGAIHWSCKER